MEISDEVNRGRLGSKYWVNSEHDSFSDITKTNFQLPYHWGHSAYIKNTEYKYSVLKPVNGYAMHFYPKPELVLNDDTAILRYKTHAEIWVEQKDNGLYSLDKTWQRQFYPSQIQTNTPDNCFDALYKFYVPWVINKNIVCSIRQIEESPFKIINNTIAFNKLEDELIWNVDWFHFAIKNIGDHIEEYRGDIYSILKIGSNICDVIIEDESIVKELIKEYDK